MIITINEYKKSIQENVGSLRKVMNNIKKYTAPFAVIAIENNKVVDQEISIQDRQLIPAFYREMSKKYPNAIIRVEDTEGQIVKESLKFDKISDDRIISAWASIIGGNQPDMKTMRKDIQDLMKRDSITFIQIEKEIDNINVTESNISSKLNKETIIHILKLKINNELKETQTKYKRDPNGFGGGPDFKGFYGGQLKGEKEAYTKMLNMLNDFEK